MSLGKQRIPILNNPVFTHILLALSKKSHSSYSLSKEIEKAQPTLYEQLKVLEKEGYVLPDKSKKNTYRVNFHKIAKERINNLFDSVEKQIHNYISYTQREQPSEIQKDKDDVFIKPKNKTMFNKNTKALINFYSSILEKILPNLYVKEYYNSTLNKLMDSLDVFLDSYPKFLGQDEKNKKEDEIAEFFVSLSNIKRKDPLIQRLIEESFKSKKS